MVSVDMPTARVRYGQTGVRHRVRYGQGGVRYRVRYGMVRSRRGTVRVMMSTIQLSYMIRYRYTSTCECYRMLKEFLCNVM